MRVRDCIKPVDTGGGGSQDLLEAAGPDDPVRRSHVHRGESGLILP